MKITGRVVGGSKVGRELGYPTANIAADGLGDVTGGVYAARVLYDGRRWGAMANLGVKPTFPGGGERILELHLLDFEGDLYGQELEVELVEFIRPERKFATPCELREQIEKDEKQIKNVLGPKYSV